MACCRFSRSPLAVSWNLPRVSLASSRNDWLLLFRASPARALKASDSLPRVVEHGQLFFGVLALLVERGGKLHELGPEVRLGGLCFGQPLFALLHAGVQFVDGLLPRGQTFGQRDAFGVVLRAAAVAGLLDLRAEHQPHRPAADGQADQERQDGQE